ncbi:RCC1 domain-containing protein [Nocardioides pacificus]
MPPTLAGLLAPLLVAAGLVVLVADGGSDQGTAAAAVAAPAAQARADASCTDVLVLGMAGNAEGARAGAPLGVSLEPFRKRFVAAATTGGRTVEVRSVGRGTAPARVLKKSRRASGPATKAINRRSVSRWAGPVSTDVTRIRSAVASAASSCPDQQVVLVGYAQGAMAMHRTLSALHPQDAATDRVVAAALVSDGDRTPATRSRSMGAPNAGTQARGVQAFFRKAVLDVPRPGSPVPVWSVCSRGDAVCDVSGKRVDAALNVHKGYGQRRAARSLDRTALQVWGHVERWARPVAGLAARTAIVSEPMNQQLPVLVAAGDRSRVAFTALSPEDLPPGISLSSAGVLSGTPTTTGSWTLRYTVSNTASPVFDHPVAGEVQIQVTAASEASRSVAAGGEHSCVIRTDGTLWCWGLNDRGQLGHGQGGNAATAPVQVGNATDWRSVSAGGASTCAVRTNGSLWCWGLNHRGQLGLGTNKSRPTPTQVGSATDWREVSVGWFGACGIRTDGSLWCWGDNSAGQIGDGTTTRRLAPVKVPGADWRNVDVGGWHTCATTGAGSLSCWGRNDFGEIGDGTIANRRQPTPVAGDGWADVAASWSHSCGVTRGGEVRCWGRNDRGQLGDGTQRDRRRPTLVSGGLEAREVATGDVHSCATAANGATWCWGGNDYGALGTGNQASSNVPVRTQGAYRGLSGGWMHTCALTVSESLRCWGNNERGQLGNGTNSDLRAPDASPRTTAPARRARANAATFTLATYNVLGDVHTAPYKHDDQFAPSRIRAEWFADSLAAIGNPDVIGLHEVERQQFQSIMRATGGQFSAFPGTELKEPGGIQQSLLWRTSVWEATAKRTLKIPFIQGERPMPVVRLRHRATGKQIWVINAHNAPRDLQKQRNIAVRREIALIKELRATKLPVFFIGDLNEKKTVFCKVVTQTDLISPMGGSGAGGTCTLPKQRMRIDWIFGPPNVSYAGFQMSRATLVRRSTDHAVPVVRVTLP